MPDPDGVHFSATGLRYESPLRLRFGQAILRVFEQARDEKQ
jgi:hypothetical protein